VFYHAFSALITITADVDNTPPRCVRADALNNSSVTLETLQARHIDKRTTQALEAYERNWCVPQRMPLGCV
jgi:hypothetical protein